MDVELSYCPVIKCILWNPIISKLLWPVINEAEGCSIILNIYIIILLILFQIWTHIRFKSLLMSSSYKDGKIQEKNSYSLYISSNYFYCTNKIPGNRKI